MEKSFWFVAIFGLAIIIFAIYFSQEDQESKSGINPISYEGEEIDISLAQPQELYSLLITNVAFEIKIFGGLLLALLVMAIISAKMPIETNIAKEAKDRIWQMILKNRPTDSDSVTARQIRLTEGSRRYRWRLFSQIRKNNPDK